MCIHVGSVYVCVSAVAHVYHSKHVEVIGVRSFLYHVGLGLLASSYGKAFLPQTHLTTRSC